MTALVATGADDDGELEIKATINGGVADPAAVADWLTTGLSLPSGNNTSGAKVTVKAPKVTIEVTGSRKGYGRVFLSGTAKAGATVEIYRKTTSSSSNYSLVSSVKADEDGKFGDDFLITRSMTYVAKAGSITSNQATATVTSAPKLTATALGKGRVRLSVDGNPDARVKATFSRVISTSSRKSLGSVLTNSDGKGSIIVTVPKGKRTFRVYYQAPGTVKGWTEVRITVK